MPRPLRVLLAALACVLPTGGCAGGDDDASGSSDPPPVAQPEGFPNAAGQSLADLRRQVGESGPVAAPVVSQLRSGSKNRLAFGLFDRDRAQIARARVAVYVAPTRGGPATGPFAARYESLAVKRQFRRESTERNAARSLYVAEVPFEDPGKYEMLAVARLDERLVGSTPAGRLLDVTDDDTVPDVGDRAPVMPASAKTPAVLLFASAGLCESRLCGPVAELARQVEAANPGKAEFIHVEVYRGNVKKNGFSRQVLAWKLEPIEPWLFAIDRDGRIAARLEGAFSARELQRALEKATRR